MPSFLLAEEELLILISNAILILMAKHTVDAGLFQLVIFIHRTLVYIFMFLLISQGTMGAFLVPLIRQML